MTTLQFHDVRDFQAMKFDSGQEVVRGFINTGERVLLVAAQKSGKTIFCLQLGLAVAAGVKFADYWEVPKARRVIYVATEGSKAELQDEMRRIEVHQGAAERGMFKLCYTPTLSINTDTEVYNQLRREIDAFQPDLLVLDCLYRVHAGSLNDDGLIKVTTERINMLGENLAILIPHHRHRPKHDQYGIEINEGGNSYFGSAMLMGWATAQYGMSFSLLSHQGSIEAFDERGVPKFGQPKDLELIDPPEELYWVVTEKEMSPLAKTILNEMDRFEGMGIREIGRVLGGIHHTTIRGAVQELVGRKLVKTVSLGKGKSMTIGRVS